MIIDKRRRNERSTSTQKQKYACSNNGHIKPAINSYLFIGDPSHCRVWLSAVCRCSDSSDDATLHLAVQKRSRSRAWTLHEQNPKQSIRERSCWWCGRRSLRRRRDHPGSCWSARYVHLQGTIQIRQLQVVISAIINLLLCCPKTY